MGDNIHWLEVKIQSHGELAEALAEVLGRFVSGGVIVETVTQFNPYNQENEATGEVVVSGYLIVDETLESKKEKLEEALWHLNQIMPIPPPKFKEIKNQKWMNAWKEHYTPISIGENLLILPAWQAPAQGETRHIIRINPAMAFGTGTHPTTQLCMRLLENHIKPGKDVIDVGCGSGILSIAALKMGASHVLAVDVDRQAINSTLENAALNHISPTKFETGEGSVKEVLSGVFTIHNASLVVVNILTTIIIRLFNQGLGDTVKNQGTLLLSGILNHQEKEILDVAMGKNFELLERLTDMDWVSLAFRKKMIE